LKNLTHKKNSTLLTNISARGGKKEKREKKRKKRKQKRKAF
jgi:hypothetical protein